MMVVLIEAETRMQAWSSATEHLLESGDTYNIVLEVASPAAQPLQDRELARRLDETYCARGKLGIHSIAETIFPAWEYKHRGLAGVFEKYPQEFTTFDEHGDVGWGTYAYRLIHDLGSDGQPFNPLEVLISKMRRMRRGEVDNFRAVFELSLYRAASDRNQFRNLPCLSHLSFKLDEDTVHLAALYRMHDYHYKVPGNLLGLSRLQACVATEAGARVGKLVVHSTLAFIDGSKKDLAGLLKGAEP